MALDPESELDQIYLLPPGQFISARNQLEKRLKAAGQAAEAKQVKALAKPKLTAWLVNWIALSQGEALAQLRSAGQSVAVAQAEGDGAALLAASDGRKQAVKRCVELAREACDAHGEKLGAAAERELFTCLETIATQPADPAAPDRPGRMTQPLGAAGFDAFGVAGFALSGAATTSAPPPKKKETKSAKQPPEVSEEEKRAAAVAALKQKLEEAQALLDRLTERVQAAKQQVESAENRRTETQSELEATQAEYQAMLEAAERKKSEVARKKRDLERAEDALQSQTKGLRQLVEQHGAAQHVVAEIERSLQPT
ncbi:MAG: hypothetical protein H6718_28365 [Polyangiaceae bacterium]|nr:hypothetical protein [Polyangiaceae bacterium]